MAVGAAILDAQQQVGTEEPFVQQGHRIVSQRGDELTGQGDFPLAVRADGRIGQHMRADIHQGDQPQHRIGSLPVGCGVTRAEMGSELRGLLRSEQGTIDGEDLQPLPRVPGITLSSPNPGALFEQPLNRLFTESLAGLRQSTVGKQDIIGQAVGTDVEAPRDLGNGLIAEKGHADHEPQDQVRG
ncbi:hypothetical protein D3C78_1031250 [compost metagenome]